MANKPGTEEILASRYVFLDTSVLEAMSFDFKGEALHGLCRHDKVTILLSEIIVREVRDHLARAAQESVRAHKKFSRDARVLRTSAGEVYEHLFRRFDAVDAEKCLQESFEEFLASKNVETLKCEIPITQVLEMYFDRRPPFGDAKQKFEFPDAFALESIRQWAQENDEKVYVVSKDGGMNDYCAGVENLISVSDVETFLDMVISEDRAAAADVKRLIAGEEQVFEERVHQDFPDLGFYVDDREGWLEDVVVTGVEILAVLILELDGDEALVELEVRVDFAASVTYEDLEHAPYDSETGRYMFVEEVSDRWEREFSGKCQAHLVNISLDPPRFSLDRFEINGGDDIKVEFDNLWPYK